MIRRFLLFAGILLLGVKESSAQEDWETYVLYIKERPVSVMVDLGFGSSPAAKQNHHVIIISLQLNSAQKDGLPVWKDIKKLDTVENVLVDKLHGELRAVYTGRYTSSGKRDFYFYTNDTSQYRTHIQSVLSAYPEYKYNILCKRDEDLSNYKEVLYPTQVELQRIYNRRMIDHLVKAGDRLTAPRAVDHLLFFKTDTDRKNFAAMVMEKGFTVIQATEEKGIKDRPFSLELSRVDKVDEETIDEVSLLLWELALKFGARYEGWETFVVTPSEQKK